MQKRPGQTEKDRTELVFGPSNQTKCWNSVRHYRPELQEAVAFAHALLLFFFSGRLMLAAGVGNLRRLAKLVGNNVYSDLSQTRRGQAATGLKPAGGIVSRKDRKSSNSSLRQVVHGLTLSSGLCVWLWGEAWADIGQGNAEWRIAWESIGSARSQRRGYTDAPNPGSPLSD